MEAPCDKPPVSSSGIDNTLPLRKPITCTRMLRPDEVRTSQKSPIAAAGPEDSSSSPTMAVTLPVQRSGSIVSTWRK